MADRKHNAPVSRGLHRNIAQEEEGVDPRSRTLAKVEEHLDHSHMGELDHTHVQVAEVGSYFAEDTGQPEELENLAAIGVVARKLVAPDRG